MDSLDREIRRCEDELATRSPGDSDRPPLLHSLACGFRGRFLIAGRETDLHTAIERSEAAIAEAPPGDTLLPVYQNTLANSLGDRYELTRAPADLQRAIALLEGAVLACAPEDRPEFSANLATTLWDRYLRDGRPEDLDETIARFDAALEDAPEQARSGLQCNLSGALQDRYARTGSLDDLARAVTAARHAVDGTEKEDANAVLYLNALGAALLSRFLREPEATDLDEAIHRLKAGVGLCPRGSPRRAKLLGNLGIALAARGTTADLARAVDVHAAAAREAAGRADEALHLDDLAAALLDRYQQTGRRRDLRWAIRVWRRAARRTPAEDPRRPRRLANLARG